MLDKSVIREQILQQRKSAYAQTDEITMHRTALSLWGYITHRMGWIDPNDYQGKIIASFYSIGSEIPTAPLHTIIEKQGAINALPHVGQVAQPFAFYKWSVGDDLTPDASGTPAPNTPALIQPDVVIVPFVAIDRGGHRIGMGGGYYDRTLALLKGQNPDIPLIAYGFDCQRVDCVPAEPFDFPVDAWVSEQQIYEF